MANAEDHQADSPAMRQPSAGLEPVPRRALLRDFSRLLFVAVILPVLAIAALYLWQSGRSVRSQYAMRLTDAAEATGREVDYFTQMHLAVLQVIAERRTTTGNVDDEAAWAADLHRVHRYYPDFSTLAVVDEAGKLALIEPASQEVRGVSVDDRSYYSEPRRTGRPHVSDAYRGRVISDVPSIALSAPFFSGGRFAGVVSGAIRIDSFPALRNQSDQVRDFEMLLVDRNHTVVFASPGLRFRSLDVLAPEGRDAPLRSLQSRRPGAMQPLSGVMADGGDAYAVATPLRSGWRLLVLVPESTVVASVRGSTPVTLGLLALLLLGVLAVTGSQLRRLGGYVRDLLDRMQRFALDNQGLPASPESLPEELAPIADALNQLAARAHRAYDEVSASLDEQRRLRAELQAMARHLLTVQENERRTLSRELHDDIGQAITAIKLGAMAVQDEPDAGRRHEILVEIVDITDQTVTKLRNLSMLLRPPQLDTLGLEMALRWQADTLFRSGRPQLELDLEPLPERPDPAVELACFRIAQEALTNILRHSEATRVSLKLAPDASGQNLCLAVADDGRGFGPGQTHGLGLVTMRERAEQLGGTLRTDTAPGQGTRVSLCLPMHVREPAG